MARNEVRLKEIRSRRSSISEFDRLNLSRSERGHFSTSSPSSVPNSISTDQQRFSKVTNCDLATNPKVF